jgi:hypothetical protein
MKAPRPTARAPRRALHAIASGGEMSELLPAVGIMVVLVVGACCLGSLLLGGPVSAASSVTGCCRSSLARAYRDRRAETIRRARSVRENRFENVQVVQRVQFVPARGRNVAV